MLCLNLAGNTFAFFRLNGTAISNSPNSMISQFQFSNAKEHMDIVWAVSMIPPPTIAGSRKLPLLVTKV